MKSLEKRSHNEKMRGMMQRYRLQEWVWIGVLAVAVLIMIGVTAWPWIQRL